LALHFWRYIFGQWFEVVEQLRFKKILTKVSGKVRSSRWRFFNVLVNDQTDVRRLTHWGVHD
jgi:hypothetical protein